MQTLSSFSMVGVGQPLTLSLDTLEGLVEGQVVVIPSAGYFIVNTLTGPSDQVALTALVLIAAAGTTIPKGVPVVASGIPPVSLLQKTTVVDPSLSGYSTVALQEVVLTNTQTQLQNVYFGTTTPGATVSVYDYLGMAATNALVINGDPNIYLPGITPAPSITLNTAYALVRLTLVPSLGWVSY